MPSWPLFKGCGRSAVLVTIVLGGVSVTLAWAQEQRTKYQLPSDSAKPASSEAVKPTADDAGKPAAPSAAAAKVVGFRSALFGMDEAQVRAAVTKDFGVPGSAIRKSQNLGDRTDVLTVRVPDVLQGGGTSDVAYAFGYKSKKLTQVSVIWSKGTDKAMTPERMLANGEALREYFQGEGYEPKTIVVNSALKDGILLFRGADGDGRTTALMLHGTTVATQDKATQTFVPNALLLFYLADPKAPDVFKIQAGRF